MESCHIAIAQFSLYLRHAQTLKDKRQIISSILQKLKNEGFSATETAHQDSHQRSVVGVALVGRNPTWLEEQLESALRKFEVDCEILEAKKEIIDFPT